MKKYNITTHLLDNFYVNEEINESVYKTLLKEGCPESWFSPVEEEVKAGRYFKEGRHIYRIMGKSETRGMDWETVPITDAGCDKTHFKQWKIEQEGTFLDTDSIKSALIEEAKRRGFEHDNFDCLVASNTLTSNEYDYHSDADILYLGSNACYSNGKFAEIVEDEPIQINGHEAEFKDGYVQFGCAKIENEYFKIFADVHPGSAWYNEGRGNRTVEAVKIGNGMFTIEDIKKIAKRIKS